MPTGEHMAGKTNNKGGRPRSCYLHPSHARNIWKVWQVPEAARLVQDLEQAGGNITKFLRNATTEMSEWEPLLAVVLEEIEKADAELQARWTELLERSERVRLLMAEHVALDSLIPEEVVEEEEEEGSKKKKRKKGNDAQHNQTLKFFLQNRLPGKYKTKPTDAAPPSGFTAEQKEFMDKLSSLSTVTSDVD